MNAHSPYEELLPLYAAGQLEGDQRSMIHAHLAACPECQADLELWQAVSAEIKTSALLIEAPAGLPERALEKIHTPGPLVSAFQRAAALLGAQLSLVQREIWPSSAAVMGMGAVVGLISERIEIIYLLAPLVAASTLAFITGPGNDPAQELVLSTPTSPWKILLARMSIVSAYNMLLGTAVSLLLLFVVPPGLLGSIVMGWLGPLAFLSALALLLSLWLGSHNAIAIAYTLWMLQYAPFVQLSQWMASPVWASIQAAYRQFWHSPVLLLALSIFLTAAALCSARRTMVRASA